MRADMHIPRVHSLLLTQPGADIDFCGQPPEWLDLSAGEATWLVRTRGAATPACWPAGLRGRTKSERHAVKISPAHVQRVIAPTELIAALPLQESESRSAPALEAVSEVRRILEHCHPDLSWGPVGSVALELASGREWVQAGSDLDIVIYTEIAIETALADRLLEAFSALSVRVDALVEGPTGGISLAEWASRSGPWLVRSAKGPVLSSVPWSVMGCGSAP
jgi:phosphoribosyl-dephospho-CoA transferase